MTPRVRRWLLSGLACLGAAVGAAAPVQPGQVWTLAATTAEGEMFRTSLRVDAAPDLTSPDVPATYHADRGALLLDTARGVLIVLDLLDARRGGLGLACVVDGPLDAPEVVGVLASGTLADLPARLEAALAVIGVAHTPADRAAAVQELKLGTCTLTRTP